jgi:hypothetical protein
LKIPDIGFVLGEEGGSQEEERQGEEEKGRPGEAGRQGSGEAGEAGEAGEFCDKFPTFHGVIILK